MSWVFFYRGSSKGNKNKRVNAVLSNLPKNVSAIIL